MTERYNIVPPFGDSSLLDTRWGTELDFDFNENNLTPEQISLARKIISKNRAKGIVKIVNELSYAGFRGEIQNRAELSLPICVCLTSKIEKYD